MPNFKATRLQMWSFIIWSTSSYSWIRPCSVCFDLLKSELGHPSEQGFVVFLCCMLKYSLEFVCLPFVERDTSYFNYDLNIRILFFKPKIFPSLILLFLIWSFIVSGYIIKLYKKQTEVIQHDKSINICNMGQGETRRRKYKKLKLDSGHAVTTAQVTDS
jgi:hypothetical protein